MVLKILAFWLALGSAQWILLDEDAPPEASTGPNAQPEPGAFGSLWCIGEEDLYLFTARSAVKRYSSVGLWIPKEFETSSNGLVSIGRSSFPRSAQEAALWKYENDLKRWFLQPDPAIPQRTNSAYWTLRDRFYLYGGLSSSNELLNDMQVYNPRTRQFTELAPSVPASSGAFWAHPASNRLYIWGGYAPNLTNSLRAYDIITNKWETVATTGTPEASVHPSATLSQSETLVYVYSGDRLWQLDLTTFVWSASPLEGSDASPPGPGRTGAIIWRYEDSIMLYGGQSGSKVYSDTWVYSIKGKRWFVKSPDGPATRWGSSYCTNPRSSDLYLFGGGEVHNDIWKYGTPSIRNIFQQLHFKLDSITLTSLIGAIASSLIFFILVICLIIVCVVRCRKMRTRYIRPNTVTVNHEHDTIEF
jgi:hypothetical protein